MSSVELRFPLQNEAQYDARMSAENLALLFVSCEACVTHRIVPERQICKLQTKLYGTPAV